ncbi:MAG: hypothetical protein HQM08_14025 [Candidatus Riflebacteria bacterium]|nr:hypothetical protein [Candidatus Riflebacteria bacterium]
MSKENMTIECEKFQFELSTWLDGEGNEPSNHVQNCPNCQEFQKSLERTKQFLKTESGKIFPTPLLKKIIKNASIHTNSSQGSNPSLVFEEFFRIFFANLKPAFIAFISLLIIFGVLKSPSSNQKSQQIKALSILNAQIDEKNSQISLQQNSDLQLEIPPKGVLKIWSGPAKLTWNTSHGNDIDLVQGRACFEWNSQKNGNLCFKLGKIVLNITGTIWRASFEEEKGYSIDLAEGKITIQDQNGTKTELAALNRISFRENLASATIEPFNPYCDKELNAAFGKVIMGGR